MPCGSAKKPRFIAGENSCDSVWLIPHLLNDQIVAILRAAQEDYRLGEKGRKAREAAMAAEWRDCFGAPDEDRTALIAKRDASRIAVDVGTLKIGDMIEKDGDLHRINHVSGEIDLNGRMICHAWFGTFGAEMARKSAIMTLSSKRERERMLDTWASEDITDTIMSIVRTEDGCFNDMWSMRARVLIAALVAALCDLRDQGRIALTLQLIRENLTLGDAAAWAQGDMPVPASLIDLPQEAWERIRSTPGLIPLYLRALEGDMSEATTLSMKAFFDTLPGFSLEKAMMGENQKDVTIEMTGYLTMQITKPLGA